MECLATAISSGSYVIPELMAVGINGVGDFEDALRQMYKFGLPYGLPAPIEAGGVQGWWGPIDDAHAHYYTHLPNMALAAYRCMVAVDGAVPGPAWDVPPAVQHPNGVCGNLNRNLLGYRVKQAIQVAQRLEFFTTCDVTADAFPHDIEGVPWNSNLMGRVSSVLSTLKGMKMGSVSDKPAGSIAQLGVCYRHRGYDGYDVPLPHLPFEEEIQVAFVQPVDAKIALGMSVFIYRVWHYTFAGAAPPARARHEMDLLDPGPEVRAAGALFHMWFPDDMGGFVNVAQAAIDVCNNTFNRDPHRFRLTEHIMPVERPVRRLSDMLLGRRKS